VSKQCGLPREKGKNVDKKTWGGQLTGEGIEASVERIAKRNSKGGERRREQERRRKEEKKLITSGKRRSKGQKGKVTRFL